MKTLKILAIVLPMCVALVACGGKKGEPTNSAETAFVTAQDLCDYLPYINGQQLTFTTPSSKMTYTWTVKSVSVDTVNNTGSVRVKFYSRISIGEAFYLRFIAKTTDNKHLTFAYAVWDLEDETEEGPNFDGWGDDFEAEYELTSRDDLPQLIEFIEDMESAGVASIEKGKGIVSFVDPLSETWVFNLKQ